MNFSEYQELAMKTNWGSKFELEIEGNWMFPLVGLMDEVGEAAKVIKKFVRARPLGQRLYQKLPEHQAKKLKEEVGDMLWHIAELCEATGLSLEECAVHNIERTKRRTHWDGRDPDLA